MWGMFEHFDNYNSVPAVFQKVASDLPARAAYWQILADAPLARDGRRRRIARNYIEVRKRVAAVAGFLEAQGVKYGDRVAILSNSRPEWLEADLAIQSLGAVSVSLYQNLPSEQVAYILFDSEAEWIFVENEEQCHKVLELIREAVDIPAHEDRPAQKALVRLRGIVSFEQVAYHGLVYNWESILKEERPCDFSAVATLVPDDLATLVYTSGTTGPPKGVLQTHRNHLSNLRQAASAGILASDARMLLILPLAHSFARLLGYLGLFTTAELLFPAIASRTTSRPDPDSITRDLREADATLLPVVPRVLEKLRTGVYERARETSAMGWCLRQTLSAALKVQGEKDIGLSVRLRYRLTSPLRRALCRKLFGDHLEYIVSGGAKLNVEVADFFEALGILVLEGYGLTETCVATNINRPSRRRRGSVGPVLADDIELTIAKDGEILFRGPNVARGYFKRRSATEAAWDPDGWFHTGDIGELSPEGFLSVIGRKKELLVTSNGKNIAPEPIEFALQRSRFIAQALLVGDSRPYPCALLVLERDVVQQWAVEQRHQLGDDWDQDPAVYDLIVSELEQVNAQLMYHEKVRHFAIIGEGFTIENGLMTPTLKIRRNAVLDRYAHKIATFYADV